MQSKAVVSSWAFLILLLISQTKASEKCEARDKCGECMASADCFWCLDDRQEGVQQRCFSVFQETRCSEVYNPKSKTSIKENLPLNPEGTEGRIIHIQPQIARVKIRPDSARDVHRVKFSVTQSKKYPVDLYFLLDLSWSMKGTRDTFAEKGGEIIKGIKKITEDLRIGFGSYVEKNLPPFTSSVTYYDCPSEGSACPESYGFFHKTSIRELEAEEFKEEVLGSPLAENVDHPESALDGLLQAMVCWNHIGWRNESRKIILLATDRDYHFAMDGKLVGILARNDGKCHLNGTVGDSGFYTHSSLLDYPSIPQINAIAKQNSFNLIFTVIEQYENIWQEMANLVDGSVVKQLESDAANIVQLIEEEYRKITSTVSVQASNVPNNVSITFKSKCNRFFEEKETSTCDNIEIGTAVEFVAEIKASKCLEEPMNFEISPVGINQSLAVQIDTICSCDCEERGNEGFIANDPMCNEHGDNECGVCSCHPGFTGQFCECNYEEGKKIDSEELNERCRDPNTGLICNRGGTCECGTCVCFDNKVNHGKFCECDDSTCLRDLSNRLCSGHGECICGECECDQDWSGASCDCHNVTSDCMSPFNRKVCSGQGECICNVCSCQTDDAGGFFTGDFCERSPNELQPCSILAPDVEYMAFQSGPREGDPSKDIVFEYKEVAVKNMTDEIRDLKACKETNENNCQFIFTPILSGDDIIVYLHIIDGEKEKCPKVNALAISLGLFGVILLLGLLFLIVWKCWIVIEDKRIVAKFQRESEQVFASQQNPNDIYKSPITTYENPMHGKAFS